MSLSVVWIAQQPTFNTSGSNLMPRMAMDSLGNVYITYETSGVSSGQTLSGGYDIVIFKIDGSGTLQWILQQPTFNTISADVQPDLAIDKQDYLYVTYQTNGTVSGQTHTGSGMDIAVIKIDTIYGRVLWTAQRPTFNTMADDLNPSIAVDPDGYIYVYGVRGSKKELLLSRVKDVDFEKFSEWRFWDGVSWNESIHAAAALTDRISNEMSVSYMEDGRVLAVYQLDTNSPNVMVQAAETPYGPFQPAKKIWETPEVFDSIDFYTYNAKAHPHLSKPGELLISYNVNSFNFLDQIVKHPFHLRPRFIRLKY